MLQSVINSERSVLHSVVAFPSVHDVRSGLARAVNLDSASASGAVLDDDDLCVHACRSSREDGDDLERPLLQSSTQGVIRVLSTPPPLPSEVRDSTLLNNTLITPDSTNSALHDLNSDNNSPSGVGGSGVFSFFSSGAATKPFLAINSNGDPFLLGAQCGSPATTAPNGDHLLLDSGIFNQDLLNTVPGEAIPVTSGLQAITKLPLGVGGSGAFSSSGSGGGVSSTFTSRHSDTALCYEPFAVKRRRLQHTAVGLRHFPISASSRDAANFSAFPVSTSNCDVANTCIVLNEDKVDTVLPPLRDDVPLSVACPTSVFVACDSLIFSGNLLASHQHNFVSVSPGLGEPNSLDSPSSRTTMDINLFPDNCLPPGRPPEPT